MGNIISKEEKELETEQELESEKEKETVNYEELLEKYKDQV